MKTSTTTVGLAAQRGGLVDSLAKNKAFSLNSYGDITYDGHTCADMGLFGLWGLVVVPFGGNSSAVSAMRVIGFLGRRRLKRALERRMVEEFANAEG